MARKQSRRKKNEQHVNAFECFWIFCVFICGKLAQFIQVWWIFITFVCHFFFLLLFSCSPYISLAECISFLALFYMLREYFSGEIKLKYAIWMEKERVVSKPNKNWISFSLDSSVIIIWLIWSAVCAILFFVRLFLFLEI